MKREMNQFTVKRLAVKKLASKTLENGRTVVALEQEDPAIEAWFEACEYDHGMVDFKVNGISTFHQAQLTENEAMDNFTAKWLEFTGLGSGQSYVSNARRQKLYKEALEALKEKMPPAVTDDGQLRVDFNKLEALIS